MLSRRSMTAMLVRPSRRAKRSGKGTISRTLTDLLGLENVTSPAGEAAQEGEAAEARGPDLRIGIDDLYVGKWSSWCYQNGHHAGSKTAFGKSLRSVFPKVKDGKLHKGGPNCYVGIGIPGEAAGSGGSGLVLGSVLT
jgi:phage/plasmid-associated DNA primase